MRGSDAVALARSAAMRQSLGREVARKFGLTMGAGKLAGKRKSARRGDGVGAHGSRHSGRCRSSPLACHRERRQARPRAVYRRAGIDAPAREMKTSTAIFTSPGKGPRKERSTQSPMGFAAGAGGRMPRHDDCGESPWALTMAGLSRMQQVKAH